MTRSVEEFEQVRLLIAARMNDCAIARSLGITWRRSTTYIVSIYRKAATARMDEFIGPKDRAVPFRRVHYAA